MSSVMAILLLWTGVEAASKDQCLICHEVLGDEPSRAFRLDIHYQKGITCAGCHGGDATTDDMEAAMDKARGFIGIPSGDRISQVCADCHSSKEKMGLFNSSLPVRQLELLESSVHGGLAVSGRERIAQCTRCHNAHGIVRVTHPRSPVSPLNVVETCAGCHADAGYMQRYNPGLAVDQLDKYRTSVHGSRNARGDLKVAQCASCHGGHDVLSATNVKSRTHALNLPRVCAACHSDAEYMKGYGIPTDQFEQFAQSVHGKAIFEKQDVGAPACNDCHGNHGATPPGVESISKVCGTCHALNADLFSASPHKRAFDEMQLPECETCHGNHAIVAATTRLLGTDDRAVCSQCHGDDDTGRGFAVASMFRRMADSLHASETEARERVEEADQKGMDIEELRFKLREVHQSRLELRTIVHAFNEARFAEVAERGLGVAAVVNAGATSAIREYMFRRIGLGVSTLIISALMVALYLYIRRIERLQKARKSSAS